MRIKSNMRLLSVLAIILMVGAIANAIVGVSFGRYNTRIIKDIPCVADLSPQPFLFGIDENGEKTDSALQWKMIGGEQYTSVCVTNSDLLGKNLSEKDITFRIRVFIPDTEQNQNESAETAQADINYDALAFTLQSAQDTKLHLSRSDYMSEQTPYSVNNQNGWIYSFHGADGEELQYTLKGNEVSDIVFDIAVRNTTIDCSRFVIYVYRIK